MQRAEMSYDTGLADGWPAMLSNVARAEVKASFSSF